MKMKKVLFSVATISLLIACGESQKPTTVETKTIPIDNIAEKQVEKVCKKGYDKKATKIAFGGFKTTQKVEVKGYFKKFTIDSTNVADIRRLESCMKWTQKIANLAIARAFLNAASGITLLLPRSASSCPRSRTTDGITRRYATR